MGTPSKIADVVTDQIVNLRESLARQGLDNGPESIRWHLRHHHHVTVSVSTIRRRLLAAGLITAEPKKRPKSSYIRFQADLPNETWQSDFTHYPLADWTDTEILAWLDDHSRYLLSLTAHRPVTGDIVAATFNQTAETHGFPASVLTDNGLVYTTRFAGGQGGRNALETRLADLGITQKHSRPNHPTTCGKVERFHQTLKRWLNNQPRPSTLIGLQALLDNFAHIYNFERPHRAIGNVPPAVAYNRLPKDQPHHAGAGVHYRIRYDRIDKTGAVSLRRAGQMHHISIGRAHTGTPIVMLINNLNIRVINQDTGELLRTLTLDPNRGYQPRFKT